MRAARDLLGDKVQSAAPWAGSYVRPLMAHEIDAHEDGARIAATLAEVEADAEERIEAAECATEEAKAEAVELQEKLDQAKGELDKAEEEDLTEAREDRLTFYSILEDLAYCLLNAGDPATSAMMKKTMERMGSVLVNEGTISSIDAAELDGLGDYLSGTAA